MSNKKSANHDLVIVGSVAFDDLDGPSGPKPDLLGGSASFAATAASYFTSGVQMVAVVGDDFPDAAIDRWQKMGVATEGIKKSPGKTFRWKGKYADDLSSRETLDTQLGVFADFKPVLPGSAKGAELVFLGNIHPTLQSDVVDQVDKPKVVAADTMNFWIEGETAALKETIKKVDILLINDEEARQLSGIQSLVGASKAIQAMGPSSVVIKRGDAGALLFTGGAAFYAPALPLGTVLDPTGAGDTFAGGFMGYLAYAGAQGPSQIRTAMIYGSVMASFCVEEFSLAGLLGLSKQQIAERFEAFANLVRFEAVPLD